MRTKTKVAGGGKAECQPMLFAIPEEITDLGKERNAKTVRCGLLGNGVFVRPMCGLCVCVCVFVRCQGLLGNYEGENVTFKGHLIGSVEHAALDLEVVSSSATLDLEVF